MGDNNKRLKLTANVLAVRMQGGRVVLSHDSDGVITHAEVCFHHCIPSRKYSVDDFVRKAYIGTGKVGDTIEEYLKESNEDFDFINLDGIRELNAEAIDGSGNGNAQLVEKAKGVVDRWRNLQKFISRFHSVASVVNQVSHVNRFIDARQEKAVA